MLAGRLSEINNKNYYPEIVVRIISYLKTLPLDNLPTGKHSVPFLDEKQAWFVILEYNTEAEDNFNPEVHHHFSDLQIVLSGCEKMAWCFDHGDFKPEGDYLEQRDILFYQKENVNLNYVIAHKHDFFLFAPSDVHITNIMHEQVSSVRKLVVKVHNDLLMRAI